MRVDELFNVTYGNKLDMNKMTPDSSGVLFIGRRGNNQGVSGRVAKLPNLITYPAGAITVALGGSKLLAAFVQQEQFYTAQNVAVLLPKNAAMSTEERLFYAMAITENRFRYTAFGREANRSFRSIELPDEVPTWVHDGAALAGDELAQSISEPISLPDLTSFRVGDLFDISSGRYVPKKDKSPGTTITITSSAANNGWAQTLDLAPIFPAGSITVARNGSVGTAFYQPEPFFGTDDIRVWRAKKGPLTECEGLFLCSIIELEKYRYSYGRKWSLELMLSTEIRLPATPQGQPDWDVMERYIRGVRFSAALTKQAS